MDIQNALKRLYEFCYVHRGKILVAVIILFIINAASQNSLSPATGGKVLFDTSVTQNYDDFGGFAAEEMALDSVSRSAAPAPGIPGSAAGLVDPSNENLIDTTQRIIKTGNLTLEVDEINQSVEAISNIATREEGFVLNSDFSEDNIGRKFGNITIRVPSDTFESVIQEIKVLAAFVAFESVNGRDVTEEFVDIQAQLINLRAEEDQFQAILSRAFEIEDVLAVTKELSRVRGQIERLEGRIRFLENQTDLSTISVSLREASEVVVPTSKWRPLNVIKQAGRDVVDSFQDFVDDSIRFVGKIIGFIPQLIILGIIYLIVRRFIRNRN